jgi:hypothetical protein
VIGPMKKKQKVGKSERELDELKFTFHGRPDGEGSLGVYDVVMFDCSPVPITYDTVDGAERGGEVQINVLKATATSNGNIFQGVGCVTGENTRLSLLDEAGLLKSKWIVTFTNEEGDNTTSGTVTFRRFDRKFVSVRIHGVHLHASSVKTLARQWSETKVRFRQEYDPEYATKITCGYVLGDERLILGHVRRNEIDFVLQKTMLSYESKWEIFGMTYNLSGSYGNPSHVTLVILI